MTKKELIEKQRRLKFDIEGLLFKKEMNPRGFTLDDQKKLSELKALLSGLYN